MGRVPFEEKTNEERITERETKKTKSEREAVFDYLAMVKEQTRDYNLKYDLELCMETLQGKENMEVRELKDAVVELSSENEKLAKQCDVLQMQILNSRTM
ncbi:hypothetical protein NEMIN01_0749 [Nematocida minor]|uniref:uncharacterized protein n=1 Tax=Nematocida minor TaxID=1912983 RepID=UPI00222101E2|nr:uncharacterized protein NEMIN01_0749 [Nematocida minor]KAI5189886.1 hypothetical protein NEMIN01_0749 [Nematocida minor]